MEKVFGELMTESQLEFYTFILPLTTIPTVILLSYLRFKVVPVWFDFLEKGNDNDR